MHLILGTAGHIDHGKTALVRALTGIDTDRLKEERERGISIDLGFARFEVGDGAVAGVVDVPGHEAFIRNMLAGAHGIDVVLLAVAADDGVMPQTEEHLDILHLLGARRGVVAMTKVDLADAARRRAVREEIAVLLDGTALAGAPLIEVSTVSGEGIDHLRAALCDALRSAPRPVPRGAFRLPVDRAFVMRGHGLVVTGTATAGAVRTGAALRVLPGGAEVRVRGVQVHGAAVEEAAYGQRVALNLHGIEPGAIARGDVIAARELERVTDRLDAWVELRPSARRPLARQAAVRLHAGTAERMARIVWLDGSEAVAPREAALAQLVLREPLALFGGDRFILRDTTARRTLGGGVVLHPFAPRPDRDRIRRLTQLAAVRDAATARERLTALLAMETGVAVAPETLAAAADLRADEVRALLAGHAGLRALPDVARAEVYVAEERWHQLREAVHGTLAAFHAAEPRLRGIEMESLRSGRLAELPAKLFRVVVEQLAAEGVLVREESLVRLPAHRGGLSPAERDAAEALVDRLTAGGLTPPDVRQLAADLALPAARLAAVLAELERTGRVARADATLYFAAAAVDGAKALIRDYAAAHDNQITAAALRDLIGASRKFSIGLLTYLDRVGFTLRLGDIRKVRG